MPGRVGELLFQAFVLARAHHRQVAPLGRAGRLLVQVDRDARLAQKAARLARQCRAILHRHAGHRHEGADVHRAHACVAAVVPGHVDQLGRTAAGTHRGFDHGFGCADEGDHRAMGVLARVHVEQRDTTHRFDLGAQGLDHRRVSAFGEVGNAFDDLLHDGLSMDQVFWKLRRRPAHTTARQGWAPNQ
jgi:hypothetical protein